MLLKKVVKKCEYFSVGYSSAFSAFPGSKNLI